MCKVNFLVVVDMQNDFLTGSLANYNQKSVKEATVKLIDEMSDKASIDSMLYIMVTRDTHKENYMETLEGKNLPVPHCIKGTQGWEVDPDIQKALDMADEKDYVFVRYMDKPTFGSYGLQDRFDEIIYNVDQEHRDEVVFTYCGVCTDICVVSNVLLNVTYADFTYNKGYNIWYRKQEENEWAYAGFYDEGTYVALIESMELYKT